MWDDRIILTLVNTTYAYMQRALTNSIRRNTPNERVWAICADVTKRESMTWRVHEILHLLDRFKQVAWMDADMLVRRPLDTFWVGTADSVRVLHRPKSSEDGKFQTGVIVFGCKTKGFVKQWADIVENELKGEWFADQRGLWMAYERHGADIVHLDLPQRFNDWRFEDDSVVWHAKGHYKNRSEKWSLEQQKYLEAT